ncbi:hypothetical protein [Streptomyces sp. DSM 15324]|uniref:hypothetical protein n=1 Tax=Streptomyces sp. DSM 15324 TaxID=1739111 RepID=UPI000AB3D3EE|nr:hypothetical protein [Streptomyces sp. DSM 15324]
MAKRRLGIPLAPPGPQFDFFALMQEFVLKRGDPSLEAMRKMTGCYSRQALHKALRGPDLPSRRLVDVLVNALFEKRSDGDTDVDEEERKQAVRRALDAWEEAVGEKTARERGGLPRAVASTEPEATTRRLPSSTPGEAAIRLTDEFRRTYELAGRPPLKQIAFWLEERGHPVGMSSISEWLNGRRIPREAETAIALVEAMRDRSFHYGESPLDSASRQVVTQLWMEAMREKQSRRHDS